MERNYKRMMNQLQMAFLAARLDKEPEGERCNLCLELHCDHSSDIKNDSFLSLTTAVEFKYA